MNTPSSLSQPTANRYPTQTSFLLNPKTQGPHNTDKSNSRKTLKRRADYGTPPPPLPASNRRGLYKIRQGGHMGPTIISQTRPRLTQYSTDLASNSCNKRVPSTFTLHSSVLERDQQERINASKNLQLSTPEDVRSERPSEERCQRRFAASRKTADDMGADRQPLSAGRSTPRGKINAPPPSPHTPVQKRTTDQTPHRLRRASN